MLNQKLTQKLLQKLSPQQIQLMKLLQVPTANLEQRIKEELEANPALEEGEDFEDRTAEDEFSLEEQYEEREDAKLDEERAQMDDEVDLSDYYDDDDIADYKLKDNNYPDPDEERVIPISVGRTFHEMLQQQLGMLELDDKKRQIAEQIIGSIDDDGYLRRELDAIVDDLAFSQNIMTDSAEVEALLKEIQQFDPPGVGARDLQECLLLQLDKVRPQSPIIRMASRIISDYFEAFTKKHFDKLQKALDLEDEDLKPVMDEILKLNPKPGFSESGTVKTEQYIIPDFFIVNNNGELELSLNRRNAPELRVSRDYKEMFKAWEENKNRTKKDKEAILFIKQKIDSAKWFIDAINQRNHTLLSTMQTIMEYQYDFFLTGDETKLRPMILKNIADRTGLDISTVSRVANSKYVQTEFGTYLLKFFFSESLSTDSGEEVSTREVKKILSDLIEAENKRDPLSDQALTEMLREKGYNIARRTVAKYREQLNLPVARLRKEL